MQLVDRNENESYTQLNNELQIRLELFKTKKIAENCFQCGHVRVSDDQNTIIRCTEWYRLAAVQMTTISMYSMKIYSICRGRLHCMSIVRVQSIEFRIINSFRLCKFY